MSRQGGEHAQRSLFKSRLDRVSGLVNPQARSLWSTPQRSGRRRGCNSQSDRAPWAPERGWFRCTPLRRWGIGGEKRTRAAGGEVVGLLGFGSAFVSPAWSALEMAEAIIFDKRKIMPVCAKLEGEYGVKGLFVGVAGILGKNGLEKVIELDLTDEEKKAFAHSADAVRKTCDEVDGMLKNL